MYSNIYEPHALMAKYVHTHTHPHAHYWWNIYTHTHTYTHPGGSEIFYACPDQPWDAPSLINGYWVPLSGVQRQGRGVNHPPLSNAEVKERVQQNHLYFTPNLARRNLNL